MRTVLIVVAVIVLLAAGAAAWAVTRWNASFPEASDEVVLLTPAIRVRIGALRAEAKFGPHDFPPLGYTGPDTPEDAPVLNAAVNEFMDKVLAEPDGPIRARKVSAMMTRSIEQLNWMMTEDRERAMGYIIEVWYVLGFKGATGRVAHGSGYPVPAGYGEPLPPGWTAPDRPRVPTPPPPPSRSALSPGR